MATSILDLMKHVQDQGDRGRALGQQSALAKLAGQAYGADPMQRREIIGQAMQVDPDAGFALGQNLQKDDTARNQKLGQMAATLAGVPEQMRAGMFRQMAPELRQMGLQVGDDYLPEYDQVVQQIAKTYGEAQQQEMRPHVVGNALVDSQGNVLYQGEAAEKWQLVNVPDGQGGTVQMEYSNGQWRQPTYSGMPAPTTGGGAQVLQDAGSFVDDVTGLVSPLGARITSTTGGKHNPGSAHYSGNAVDIGMARETPEQQAQILAALQNDPRFKVRDERTRPAGQSVWSGPHLHVERAQDAQAGRMGYTPPKSETKPPSDIERRIELARSMGASDDEIKRMVVGGNSGRDAQRISTADATKARQKQTQVSAARQQLAAVRQAFSRIKDSYSAGIGGGLLPTPEGQAFDRAVRNLAPLITAVTRVPGVGAMSDYESRLQEAGLPSRGTYEQVTVQQMDDLERLLDTIEAGYSELLGTEPAPAADTSDDDLIGKYL